MAVVQYDSNTENKCTVSPNIFTKFSQGTTISITANDGYHFTSVNSPYLSWIDTKGSTRTTDMANWFTKSLSADNKTITFVSNTDFSTDISKITCMQKSEYPIEQDKPTYPVLTLDKTNAENVTFSPADNQIEITGDNQNLTISPNNGYIFDGLPYLVYDNKDYYFTPSNNNYIFDLSNLGVITDSTAFIYARVEQTPTNPVLTLTKNLVDCAILPSVESVEIDGTSKVFTITPDTQKAFKIAPKIIINGVDHDFNLVDDVYTLDFNSLGIVDDVSGTINATALLYKNVTINAENMTFTPAPSKIFTGDVLAITATANNGYAFRIEPYIHFHNRNAYQVNFTKVTDYQYTLSLTVKDSYLDVPKTNIELSGVAIGETPILRKYGTIQVYNPSSSNMNSLATARFQQNGTVDGVTYADVDLGQYITQFKRVFIDVVTNTSADIYLGRHNTEIKAPVVNDDVVTVDCGNVTLTGENQNELDTKIYKIFLVLTCYGITPLDSVYMNKTINITYQCNIVTGYADIIISQVVENILLPIQKLRCKISQDLPYIINVEQLKNSADDDVYNEPPKIILQKQNIFNGNGFDTYKQNTIKNETGYFIIDRFVNHQINATENELNEIESLLKSGVLI